MFEKFKTFEYRLAGRPLVIETGKMAQLANGSCLVRYGDTAVLCTATASARPRDGIDFLPLSVDFGAVLPVGHIPAASISVKVPPRTRFFPPALSTAPYVPFSPRICEMTFRWFSP